MNKIAKKNFLGFQVLAILNSILPNNLLGIVHTKDESPQDKLEDMQTYKTTLASVYILYCLSAMWLQLQIIGKSLKWE